VGSPGGGRGRALAAERAGQDTLARQEWAALANDAPAPTAVERAESALRRAQWLQRGGELSAAAAAAQAALVDLATQHPQSPRLQLARQLAALR
jgi:L-alanine-DL-glutamate epimerase-like enolase superfamily enzyme